MRDVDVMTKSLSSPVGTACESGLGLFLVGCNGTAVPLGSFVADGRKQRTTGAEGSFGRRAADGLRVHCWPHIVFVLESSSTSASESESDSEDEEDDAASESSEGTGCEGSSLPVRTKVSI